MSARRRDVVAVVVCGRAGAVWMARAGGAGGWVASGLVGELANGCGMCWWEYGGNGMVCAVVVVGVRAGREGVCVVGGGCAWNTWRRNELMFRCVRPRTVCGSAYTG